MPKITALIHTSNDALRLGRTLETLRTCDEILIVDHGSTDNTTEVAQEYGAICKQTITGVDDGAYALDGKHDWVLCILPSEALSEPLEASLLEWKQTDPGKTAGYSLGLREQTKQGWQQKTAEVRLVNKGLVNWTGLLPGEVSGSGTLSGDVLRFLDSQSS